MGKFKEITIEQSKDSLTRTFKSKDQLPIKLKEYLSSQDFNFKNNGFIFTEERPMRTDSLYFLGNTTYFSNLLTYTIQSIDSDKRMVINTDINYSFFDMSFNNFLEDCF